MDSLVYIMLLEGDKYNVGYTSQRGYPWRMPAQFNKEGSAWTRLHKPLKVLETKRGGKDVERGETLRTMQMMQLHGWQNVRGAAWTACNLKLPPVALRDPKPSVYLQSSCEALEAPQELGEELAPNMLEPSACQ